MDDTYKVFLLFLAFPFILYSLSQNIKFEHISVEHGLSQSSVHGIFQDSQ